MAKEALPSAREDEGKSNDGKFVTVAKVAKTQGRIGEVAAALLTDFPERFSTRKRLFALPAKAGGARRPLLLENHWFHKGQVVLKFAGVDCISEAEELIGAEIQVPLSERAVLQDDSVYLSDLKGCTVHESGRELGKIEDVQFGSGEAPLLVVKGKKEYLIPFAAEFIERLMPEEKRLEMKLPAGLLDLDAPLSRDETQRQQQKD